VHPARALRQLGAGDVGAQELVDALAQAGELLRRERERVRVLTRRAQPVLG
jgi:hypothetical protein